MKNQKNILTHVTAIPSIAQTTFCRKFPSPEGFNFGASASTSAPPNNYSATASGWVVQMIMPEQASFPTVDVISRYLVNEINGQT